MTKAVGKGEVFDYFDELRKVIETAKVDILFAEPYLEAEFVSRYLPHVSTGVVVRLLGEQKMSELNSAVAMYGQQANMTIEVRRGADLHDRCLFVDGKRCFQSGASFKDAAKKSPTTLTEIVDAFAAMHDTYERLWLQGTPCP